MLVPVLLLLGAAALGWLSVFDRASTVAVSVVELESSVGFPLWIPFAVAGGGLLAYQLLKPKPKAAAPARPLTRDAARTAPRPLGAPEPAPVEPPPVGGTWLDALRAGARAVSDDAMGRVRFDEAGAAVTLVLTGVTREQARRRVASYASWLATIPTPPSARVRLVSSPDVEGPIVGVLRGEIAKHFGPDAVRVVSSHEGADAVFTRPDPRWKA